MPSLLIAMALVAADPTDAEVRKAVEASILYIQEDAVDWVRVMKCATCHHAPMAIWTLQEAKSRGFRVDEAALAELVKYAADDPVSSGLLPKPAKDGEGPDPDTFALSATYGMIASRAVPSPGDEAKSSRAKLAAYLGAMQKPDGSWELAGGRPPILEGPEVATLMTVLALGEVDAKARGWLDGRPAGSFQARALRLLVSARSGADPKSYATEVEAILKLQKEDGGWGQTPAMASDAYATGQALYVLAEAGVSRDRPEIGRARGFLVRTQSEEGSWPMASRPTNGGDGPAMNLRPITYAATAWATLGLLRAS